MELFKCFIEGLLDHMQPFPALNLVIIMDNCQIHKHLEIQELIYEWSVLFFILSELLLCLI